MTDKGKPGATEQRQGAGDPSPPDTFRSICLSQCCPGNPRGSEAAWKTTQQGVYSTDHQMEGFRMEGFMEEVGLLRSRHIKKSGVGRKQEEGSGWEGQQPRPPCRVYTHGHWGPESLEQREATVRFVF